MEREPLMEIKKMSYYTKIYEEPLKYAGSESTKPLTIDELNDQAQAAIASLREVMADSPTTCVDERERIGTQNGDTELEPRYSVPGGANVYGLYVAELIGYFDELPNDTGVDRLKTVTKLLDDGQVPSGGHEGCAANGSFNAVMSLIAGDNLAIGKDYARNQLGDDFDEEMYNHIVANAQKVVDNNLYEDWQEDRLFNVLGDKAGKYIERLNGSHEAKTFIRVNVPDKTVDQTELHRLTNGEDSFVNDEGCCERIEAIIADGPNADYQQRLARHAREAVLSAVAAAVPNKILHQIDVIA